MLIVTHSVRIPESELKLSFVRSSGPGGQNVNKVNSKAVLHWNVLESTCLSDGARARILTRLASRISRDGNLILSSDRFRDQTRNREDCLEKLRQMLRGALSVPKIRKKTAPTRASKKRTKVAKERNSLKKDLRRKPSRYD